MKILALECSGQPAGAALVEDDRLLAECMINHEKTHSQTLLVMLDQIRQMLNLDLQEIDAIAVTSGPGSFTGLRIGSATAKGLGLALDKPIVPVPTVDALAFNLWGCRDLICPIMDARRGQVYTGLYTFVDAPESSFAAGGPYGFSKGSASDAPFAGSAPAGLSCTGTDVSDALSCTGADVLDGSFESGIAGASSRSTAPAGLSCGGLRFVTLLRQCALSITELIDKLNETEDRVIFLGDGVPAFQEEIKKSLHRPFAFAPPMSSLQRAGSAASLGMLLYRSGKWVTADTHRPDYLRPSQAEQQFGSTGRDFRI